MKNINTLRYSRAIILKSAPKKDEIKKALETAKEKQRTEPARMQFPKTENW